MKIKAVYLLLLVLLCPVFSYASAYWMDVKGSGKVNELVRIRIYYGDINDLGIRQPQANPELALTGAFRLTVINEKNQRTSIPISLKGEGWEGTFIPRIKGIYRILGINDTHPVVDRSAVGGKSILPVDYLCATYEVGATGGLSAPLQFLDMVTEKKGALVTVKAFKDGKTAGKSTKIRVFNPENWEKELLTDENGEAFFRPTMKGLYIIREDWEDPKPGRYYDVPYSAVRHRCNYFLLIR